MNRHACVIGSGGGIGTAVVNRLKSARWSSVFEMDLDHGTVIDVTNPSSITRAFDEAKSNIPRLNLLVIASGILDHDRLNDLTLDRWQHVLAVNLTGPFLCCKEADGWLADEGRIVLISSLAARTGGAMTGTAYAVSKGGLETLTRSLAHYFADRKITVNCISPGAVMTPMMERNSESARRSIEMAAPLKRMAAPDEIAAAIEFLASKDAGFITGAIMPVNGGVRMD